MMYNTIPKNKQTFIYIKKQSFCKMLRHYSFNFFLKRLIYNMGIIYFKKGIYSLKRQK